MAKWIGAAILTITLIGVSATSAIGATTTGVITTGIIASTAIGERCDEG